MTPDEQAGMQWWNSMTEAGRAKGARGRRLEIRQRIHAQPGGRLLRYFWMRLQSFHQIADCGGTGRFDTNGPEWVGPVHMESCGTCDGTGRVRDENDDETSS